MEVVNTIPFISMCPQSEKILINYGPMLHENLVRVPVTPVGYAFCHAIRRKHEGVGILIRDSLKFQLIFISKGVSVRVATSHLVRGICVS